MIRRAAVLVLVLMCAGVAPAQPPTLTKRIEGLSMKDGHLPHAYLQGPGAAGVNWYFATTGVRALALDGQHDRHVRAYLDKYLATNTVPGGAINDVHDLTKKDIVWKVSDSDDSYAAAIVSLACAHATRPGGAQWFQTKIKGLEFMVTANILDNIDPKTKLVNTYSNFPNRFASQQGLKYLVAPGTDPKHKQYQSVRQLMDNCECYRALKDFSDYLKSINHKEANKYAKGAATIAEGIAALYDPKVKAFRTVSGGGWDNLQFYPHRLVQVAPQLFGVDLGANTNEMYNNAWQFMSAGRDEWWKGKYTDKSTNEASNMLLGLVAARRGDVKNARAQLDFFQTKLQGKYPPNFGTISELGYARMLELELNRR